MEFSASGVECVTHNAQRCVVKNTLCNERQNRRHGRSPYPRQWGTLSKGTSPSIPKGTRGFAGAGASFVVNIGATPLPAALPLFANGLSALGLLGWRRQRKLADA